MPGKKPGYPPLSSLRRAVRESVEHTSIRVIAKEIGMSPSGLHSFVYSDAKRGPQPRIYERLVRWYRADTLSKRAGKETTLTPEVARLAAAALLEHVAAEDQQEALKQLVALLGEVGGKSRPRWLSDLRRLADERREEG